MLRKFFGIQFWFLSSLGLLTLAFAYFSFLTVYTKSSQNAQPVSFRPVTTFGSTTPRTYLVYSNGFYLTQPATSLSIGYEYSATATINNFGLEAINDCDADDSGCQNQFKRDRFDGFLLSSGLVGRLKFKTAKQAADCDYICSSLISLNYTKTKLRSTTLAKICTESKFITSFFDQKCEAVTAWSEGLTLGVGDRFSPETKTNLKLLGLTHLVVISGSQVGLVFATMDSVGKRLKISRRLRTVLGWLGIGLLVILVGFQSPVLRSGISVIISSAALVFFGRRVHQFRALFYSAVILLFFNPFFLWSYSFWLSFAASIGVVLFTGRRFESPELVWLDSWSDLLASTVGAMIMTLPLTINLSGYFSPFGILANMVVLPMIPFITFANLMAFVPILGEPFIIAAAFLESLLEAGVNFFGGLVPTIPFAGFAFWEIGVYWLGVGLTVYFWRRWQNESKKEVPSV